MCTSKPQGCSTPQRKQGEPGAGSASALVAWIALPRSATFLPSTGPWCFYFEVCGMMLKRDHRAVALRPTCLRARSAYLLARSAHRQLSLRGVFAIKPSSRQAMAGRHGHAGNGKPRRPMACSALAGRQRIKGPDATAPDLFGGHTAAREPRIAASGNGEHFFFL